MSVPCSELAISRCVLGGTFQNLDFKDVATDSTPVNHDDRDRDLYGLGLRFSYARDRRLQPFVQFIFDRREYLDTFDDNGFQRDSDGYRTAVGLTSAISNRLRAEVYGGYIWQDFADPRFNAITKPDFGATVRWRATPSTMWSASVDRAVEETTLVNASSAIETRYGADIRHKLLPAVTLKSHLTYSKYDYQQISRSDDYVDAGFGLEYNITRQIYLAGDYRYLHRDSNLGVNEVGSSQDYYRHQFFITLGARLYPINDELVAGLNSLWTGSGASESGPAGFYLGGQYGYNGLATRSFEQRSEGGSDQAGYGDAGMVGGVFAGYGFNWQDWYLGLELEGRPAIASGFIVRKSPRAAASGWKK
nr:outer membrane beta-barrel protein [Methylomarinum sp. Ch1-1]MDP4519608.1 outer membrane beta-barrel protein [Methylomarinum sp. Ch1-1]